MWAIDLLECQKRNLFKMVFDGRQYAQSGAEYVGFVSGRVVRVKVADTMTFSLLTGADRHGLWSLYERVNKPIKKYYNAEITKFIPDDNAFHDIIVKFNDEKDN